MGQLVERLIYGASSGPSEEWSNWAYDNGRYAEDASERPEFVDAEEPWGLYGFRVAEPPAQVCLPLSVDHPAVKAWLAFAGKARAAGFELSGPALWLVQTEVA